MPTDIFPGNPDSGDLGDLELPGHLARRDGNRASLGSFERVLVSTVNDIEHIESQSLNGIAVVKIFLQPGANIDGAISQTTSSAEAALQNDAAGHLSAAGAAVQRVERADSAGFARQRQLSEQQLFDLATNNLRPGMATRAAAPRFRIPTAEKLRQIMVDIDPREAVSPGTFRPPMCRTRSTPRI